MIGLIFFIIALVIVIINFVVIYPLNFCSFAPLVFWLIAVLGIVGGVIFYFNIKIMHSEELEA
jgi:hypothetical protein